MDFDPELGRAIDGKYFTEGIFVDIDPDQEETFTQFDKYAKYISLEDPLLDTPWKAQDRKYFFDHPTANSYTRETSPEERSTAIRQAASMKVNMRKILESGRPFFTKVLVSDLMSPGIRVRVPVDTLDRKLEDMIIFNGWLIPGIAAKLSSLSSTLGSIKNVWIRSIHDCQQGLDGP